MPSQPHFARVRVLALRLPETPWTFSVREGPLHEERSSFTLAQPSFYHCARPLVLCTSLQGAIEKKGKCTRLAAIRNIHNVWLDEGNHTGPRVEIRNRISVFAKPVQTSCFNTKPGSEIGDDTFWNWWSLGLWRRRSPSCTTRRGTTCT